LTPQIDVDAILVAMTENKKEDITTIDGVKLTAIIGYTTSNTEPIIRIYTEAASQKQMLWPTRIIDEIKAVAGIPNRLK
jgi:phosphomannomutase